MGASLSRFCLKLVGIRLRELRREDWRAVAVRPPSAPPREICSGCLKLNAYKLKTSSPSPEPEKRQELIANSIPC
jgi:hypothetical protein